MPRPRFFAVFLICFAAAVASASAADGVVVFIKSGCAYFIVETKRGFCLVEWYGGDTPEKGDRIVGDYESYGFKDVHNLSQDSELRIWVDDYSLSKERVAEKYLKKCKD